MPSYIRHIRFIDLMVLLVDFFFFLNSSAVSECEVIILAINCTDCESLAKRLKTYELATRKAAVTVFSLIRGVRSGAALRDEFNGMKHVAYVDGAVGFAIVPIKTTSDILVPTVKLPNIALERMSKEVADIASSEWNNCIRCRHYFDIFIFDTFRLDYFS